ncbi:MAG TPA: BlaI/MecI/CopY family transcriptional regulator [Candidatus Coprenecus stercoripullorum]|nr:BlaI/MecI/CopY family transcriptional regulator [Candidatus Coprenecus stercoripullorum]
MKQRLTAKEEEVMDILWNDKGEGMFIRDIVAAMPDPKPNYNTVATQVRFLEEKGFVVRRPMANSYRYSVAISGREYRGQTVGDLVSRYYDNSYTSLVSQFVEEEKMGLEELKALIAEIENKNSGK